MDIIALYKSLPPHVPGMEEKYIPAVSRRKTGLRVKWAEAEFSTIHEHELYGYTKLSLALGVKPKYSYQTSSILKIIQYLNTHHKLNLPLDQVEKLLKPNEDNI